MKYIGAGVYQFESNLIIPAGTTAERPASPVQGSVRFNSTESRYEGYDGTDWQFLSDGPPPKELEYIVIAGGGGGSVDTAGGGGGGAGGAGGYRSSVTGESSGGGAVTEPAFTFVLGTPYSVIIGAGGNGVPAVRGNRGGNGVDSVFASITSTGGGSGGDFNVIAGATGGSGGGGAGTGGTSGLTSLEGQGELFMAHPTDRAVAVELAALGTTEMFPGVLTVVTAA
jgi:hypothetical protein